MDIYSDFDLARSSFSSLPSFLLTTGLSTILRAAHSYKGSKTHPALLSLPTSPPPPLLLNSFQPANLHYLSALASTGLVGWNRAEELPSSLRRISIICSLVLSALSSSIQGCRIESDFQTELGISKNAAFHQKKSKTATSSDEYNNASCKTPLRRQ